MGIKERNKINVISRWNKIHQKQLQHISSVKNADELRSLILGYLAGDGYIAIRKENNSNKIHYELGFYPDHKSLIKPFISAFYKLYNKTPNIKKQRNFFEIRIKSKIIVNDLLSFGPLTTKSWSVPKFKNNRCKRNWLRGMYDSDSYVGDNYIRLKTVNRDGMLQIQKLFDGFGIETVLYDYKPKNKKWNTNYMLDIRKTKSLIMFNRLIGFNHTNKELKLLNIIDKINARVV